MFFGISIWKGFWKDFGRILEGFWRPKTSIFALLGRFLGRLGRRKGKSKKRRKKKEGKEGPTTQLSILALGRYLYKGRLLDATWKSVEGDRALEAQLGASLHKRNGWRVPRNNAFNRGALTSSKNFVANSCTSSCRLRKNCLHSNRGIKLRVIASGFVACAYVQAKRNSTDPNNPSSCRSGSLTRSTKYFKLACVRCSKL